MAESLKLFAAKTAIIALAICVVGLVLLSRFEWKLLQLYLTKTTLPQNIETRNKLEQESRIISDDFGNYGSGCEIVPGFAVTARHIVGNAILDKTLGVDAGVYINSQKAHIYKYSKTSTDLVILSTKPASEKFPTASVKMSDVPLVEGQTLYTYGHPGGVPQLFQKLEVITVDKNEHGQVVEVRVKGTVVEVGISGSCVMDEHGAFVGIVKSKPPAGVPSHIGIVSVIKSFE